MIFYPMARALARAPNVRAASRTQKNCQKQDLWSDSHGARRARKCARAKNNFGFEFSK